MMAGLVVGHLTDEMVEKDKTELGNVMEREF